ncbi:MAG: UDP-glucose/GDP-mannose dehydrogenase family protein [Acidobacteriota bacterium]|nr:MAG: UDP-glucose/GDP-mannose dehydrogenase family protein [Acidobacteriota bacterium]
MKIAVIGTGYVGLAAGAGFSEFGFQVACVDIDEKKIQQLKEGRLPIYEPGLEDIVQRGQREGRLRFTVDLEEAVREAQVIFLAVGTPSAPDGSVDLEALFAAAESVARAMAKSADFQVVAVKSTVPVGTCRRLKKFLSERLPEGRPFAVASNPEFLREGSAVQDFLRPDRVVLGSDSEEALSVMKKAYDALYLIETPFVITSFETAELVKYATNAFLATKVSFINEIAGFCDAVGADVHMVARALGLDGRISRKFLHPGPGFGGSCFPKDTRALVRMGSEHRSPFRIVEAALEANERLAERMVQKIEALAGDLRGKRVGVLGLAFKPNTDDVRESPALRVAAALLKRGARVKAYDPEAMENAKRVLKGVGYANDPYEVAEGSHVLVLLTEWNQFRKLDLERIRKSMAEANFADLRNVYEPEELRAAGFRSVGVGRQGSLSGGV